MLSAPPIAKTSPCSLRITGQSVAGDSPEPGGPAAWEIMTGAPVPESYDTIVMIENTVVEDRDAKGNPTRVTIAEPVEKGRHIRHPGQDFNPGDLLASKGETLSAQHIMAMTSVGIEALAVSPKPRVTLISTGAEIIDDPAVNLRPGQIYNSNAPYLSSMLKDLGAAPTYAGVIPDIPKDYEACLTRATDSSDIIISTGAVSAGRFDFVPNSLKKLGAKIIFHKVAIRPGKPILYAQLPNGTHYLGLPGNPISAAVGLRFFGVPLLRALAGQTPETGKKITLSQDFSKPHALRFFTKAKMTWTDDVPNVDILSGQQSFKIHPMLKANCWAGAGRKSAQPPHG